jgi:hypothetical protein
MKRRNSPRGLALPRAHNLLRKVWRIPYNMKKFIKGVAYYVTAKVMVVPYWQQLYEDAYSLT